MLPEQRKRLFTLIVISVVVGLSLLVFLFFDGHLEFRGHYEVLQILPYSKEKVAFEIERSDNQALSGPRYAVVVSDHTPSTPELRRALISFWWRRNFGLADRSVNIIWSAPNLLTLATRAPGTSPDWIINQSHRIGKVVVQYSGRP
jgi:hypothetical protein